MTPITPRLALLMTLPPLMWAGNAVVGRLAAGQVPPLTLNALRWLGLLIVLLPLGWPAIATRQARAQLWARRGPLALLGLLGIGTYNALQYMALASSTALNVTLISSSLPIWMLAIGALVYGERPGARAIAGAAFSLAGVTVVLVRGEWSRLADVHFVAGDLMMVGAIIGWAFYSWLLARPHASLSGDRRPPWDWAGFLLAQALFGVVWAGLFAGVGAAVAPASVHWSPMVWMILAYVVIGPSLVAYRCWGIGVSQAGPAAAAFFGNLTPVFAAVMSAAVLGETPHLYHGVAFALIVAGIVVSSRK